MSEIHLYSRPAQRAFSPLALSSMSHRPERCACPQSGSSLKTLRLSHSTNSLILPSRSFTWSHCGYFVSKSRAVTCFTMLPVFSSDMFGVFT